MKQFPKEDKNLKHSLDISKEEENKFEADILSTMTILGSI